MKSLLFLPVIFLMLSCKERPSLPIPEAQAPITEYIRNLSFAESKDSLWLISSGESVSFDKNELPLKNIMVVPTSVIAYLDELNLLAKITGVSQSDFIYNPEIRKKLEEGELEEIGSFNEIFAEKVLVNKPDLFVSISSPTLAKFHELLKREGVKVLLIDEYEEEIPLAKAEYVKVFGKLFDREEEANGIFEEIKKNYNSLKEQLRNTDASKPALLSNHMYGDIWYMPGGKSFQARLFEDAGGNYLWAKNPSAGAQNLSFESVFERAADADVWMNAGDFSSKAEMLAYFPNYDWFAPFKNDRLYNWNARKTAKGANDYFEKGTARPDLVLRDLAAIFYPEEFPEHELYFYQKLE